jgi:hypothetical protein
MSKQREAGVLNRETTGPSADWVAKESNPCLSDGRLVFHTCQAMASEARKHQSERDERGEPMMNVDFVEQLDKQLRYIETSAREYDAGNKDEAIRIATSLRVIFHHTGETTSLLAHLRARFTRLLSSVGQPPYPQDWYSPMADIEGKFHFPAIQVAAQPVTVIEPPRYRPMLERKKLTRQVQAPDWWGNEPVIILQGKKVTRKVIVLGASNKDGGVHVDRGTPADSGGPEFKANNAHVAAVRQMAYEVLKSPELLRLAGR